MARRRRLAQVERRDAHGLPHGVRRHGLPPADVRGALLPGHEPLRRRGRLPAGDALHADRGGPVRGPRRDPLRRSRAPRVPRRARGRVRRERGAARPLRGRREPHRGIRGRAQREGQRRRLLRRRLPLRARCQARRRDALRAARQPHHQPHRQRRRQGPRAVPLQARGRRHPGEPPEPPRAPDLLALDGRRHLRRRVRDRLRHRHPLPPAGHERPRARQGAQVPPRPARALAPPVRIRREHRGPGQRVAHGDAALHAQPAREPRRGGPGGRSALRHRLRGDAALRALVRRQPVRRDGAKGERGRGGGVGGHVPARGGAGGRRGR